MKEVFHSCGTAHVEDKEPMCKIFVVLNGTRSEMLLEWDRAMRMLRHLRDNKECTQYGFEVVKKS
jgi:hypothetical protein